MSNVEPRKCADGSWNGFELCIDSERQYSTSREHASRTNRGACTSTDNTHNPGTPDFTYSTTTCPRLAALGVDLQVARVARARTNGCCTIVLPIVLLRCACCSTCKQASNLASC
eukprot:1250573-Prymnesium_polylepis.1